ncbi:piggyBac transposable element-derived protein 3 [Trichonephila clavipes]|nr:piggyBac transposable element-derived protein 3 [Trichonephila clavipes]
MLSDSNPDEMNSGTFVRNDGTGWESITFGSCRRGRIIEHNIFKVKSDPTSYAKRNIENGYAISSGRLVIDEPVLRHIESCLEEEALRQLGKNEGPTTLDELDAFISILYARGIYGANNLELDSMWSFVWCPPFFLDITSRDRFRDLMNFLQFVKKTARSERLQADKLSLISEVWKKFIENSIIFAVNQDHIDEQLFPSKARCRFPQYTPSKPDKFGIKI